MGMKYNFTDDELQSLDEIRDALIIGLFRGDKISNIEVALKRAFFVGAEHKGS